MVFYKCDICGSTVQFAQVMPATIMGAEDALYGGREKVDVCISCMRRINRMICTLREEPEDEEC